jgi:uncharacterized DUF497 family protein
MSRQAAGRSRAKLFDSTHARYVYVVRDTIVSGERRILGFGNGAGRWIFRVFTWRGNRIRPVSVRFLHEKEVKLYVEEISRLEKR